MRKAKPVILSDSDRAALEQWTRSRTLPARQVERARILLLAAQGWQDKQIAQELGCHRRKAARWCQRFLAGGLEASAREKSRSGRKPSIDAQALVQRTTQTTPAHATEWSVRLMARAGRSVSERGGTGTGHHRIHPRTQPVAQALHLDRQSPRHPGQSLPRAVRHA